MFIPYFIVYCFRHLEKNYFFFFELSFFSSAFGASVFGTSAFGASVVAFSTTGGATFSSVTCSGLVSISIPIFFFIFSAILADLPVLSLK